MTMVDFDPFQRPHQKPMPFHNNHGGIQPLTKIVSDSQYQAMGQQQPAMKPHGHTRNVSSSVFPISNPMSSPPSSNYQQTMNTNRRTPSNATSSSIVTTSTRDGAIPTRTSSTVSVSLRRSTSSRSGQSMTPTSYVALMRKQKATVWCDRSQHEDPRMVAQAKAAKMRATREIVGSNGQGRNSMNGSMGSGSLGVRSRIRHHGAPKAVGYSSANLVGSAVPMRLSASEVGDEDNSDDDDSQRNVYQQRSGSGRSSLVGNQRLATLNQRPPGRLSQGSTPPSGQGSSPAEGMTELAETSETPMPGERQRQASGDYFEHPSGNGGSGSSSEREASFGNVSDMNGPYHYGSTKKEEGKTAEELSRRGSVDERAATMRGAVRLFVANPDLSD